ncbi:NADP-dependent isocitrate dehydrogenase [Microbacter margulisiae]|uniref:Isocitrate dehydrogenase [NADP] n=1 Tax=Microbacter margulisiae TaxID=1350067 RepID=A0A7W5DS17_9PORP|nr:NADP-dependent isocitrate dehydrogenase [Microbacter margulisiae]MBB3188020.1 isocitrate dehydrogenase [Microbacter margulisiae]
MEITFTNHQIQTPDNPTIPYIEGDGIGPEIWTAAKQVMDAAVRKAYNGKRHIEWKEVLAGEKAFNQTGTWLPNDTLKAFQTYRIGIKGPLTTPIGGGIRSLNVALRQTLDLFVCLRPVRWFKGVPAPVKHPENVKMVIFRENTEDIYAGIEFELGKPETDIFRHFLTDEMGISKVRFPESSAFGVKPISKDGSERLVRSAIHYAITNHLPSVTLVHKGNIMKYTEGAFKNWGYQIAANEFGDAVFCWPTYLEIKKRDGKRAADEAFENAKTQGKIIIKDVITDAFLQESLLHPEDHSVIATMNLNGDYISDQLAACVGGIGIAPGANINYDSGHAIFEATHGTAPDIAGTGKANPSSLLLSGVMMLDYLGWTEAGKLIENALEALMAEGKMTADLYSQTEHATLLTTPAYADAMLAKIESAF